MTQRDERYLDPSSEHSDPAVVDAVADLDRAYIIAPPPHLRAAMDRTVYAHMTAPPRYTPAARRSRLPAWGRRLAVTRLRLVSLVAVLLLALGGVAGYLRVQAPTPASAQTMRILHRAAAALRLAPNQAAHATYRITVSVGAMAADSSKAAGGLAGVADVWIQADANGAPTLSAQTLTMDKPGMNSRYIQTGRQVYAYNPEMRGDNSIVLGPGARVHPSWLVPADVFDGASVTQELSTLATQSPQRVQLLGQQSLAGHTVDVIEVDGWTDRPAQRTTFYFDAQSYLLRGFDAVSRDPSYPMPSWQARLSSYATLPASAVPPHTFTLNAPATAQVAPLDLADPAAFKTFQTAFAGVCHSGATMKELLRSTGKSLLAACQATAPGMTASGLVAALAAPTKVALAAAVAAGQITAAQEASSLAALQAQLTTLVTAPPPST